MLVLSRQRDQTIVIGDDIEITVVELLPQLLTFLDWEMATLGDPLMDLGASLAYWMQRGDPWLLRLMRLQPTTLPGMMTRDEVVTYYYAKRGLDLATFDFYRIFGIFRPGRRSLGRSAPKSRPLTRMPP